MKKIKGILRKYTMGGFTGAGIAEAGTLAGNLLTASADTDAYGRNKNAVVGGTISSAAQGASLGSAIAPGIGTAIGAVAGGIYGFANAQEEQRLANEMKTKTENDIRGNQYQLNKNRADAFYGSDPTYQRGRMFSQNFKLGGTLPIKTMGGDIAYDGPTHENGGIPVDEQGLPSEMTGQEPIAEVEGGETMKKDENYVFSDSLSPEQGIVKKGAKGTFADKHRKILTSNKELEKKLELNPNDVAVKNTVLINQMLADKLQQEQEQVKAQIQQQMPVEGQETMRMGGKLKKYRLGGGEDFPPFQLGKPNTNDGEKLGEENPLPLPLGTIGAAARFAAENGTRLFANQLAERKGPNQFEGMPINEDLKDITPYSQNPITDPYKMNTQIKGSTFGMFPKISPKTTEPNNLRANIGYGTDLGLNPSSQNFGYRDMTLPKSTFPELPKYQQPPAEQNLPNTGKIPLITKTDLLQKGNPSSKMNFSPNEVLGMVKGVKGAEISNQLPEFIRRMNIPENGTENPTDTKKGNDFISNLISGLGGKKGTEKDPNSKGSDNTSTSDQSKMSTDRQKQLLMAGNTLASFIDNAANASVIKSNKADLHPDQKFTDPMEAKLLDYSAQRAEADRQIRGFNQGLDQNVSSSVQGNRMKLGALAQNINAKNQINQNEENANQQIKSQVNQMNNQIQQANNQIDQQNRLNRWTQRREVAAQEGQNKAQIGQDLITANTNQQKLMENERVNALTDKFYNDQLTTNKEQQKVGLLTSHPDTVKTIFAMYDKDKMMSQFNMTDAEYESIKMQLNDPNKYKKWKEAQEQTTQLTATINGKGNVSVTNEQTGNTNTGGNVKVNRFGGILNKYGNRK